MAISLGILILPLVQLDSLGLTLSKILHFLTFLETLPSFGADDMLAYQLDLETTYTSLSVVLEDQKHNKYEIIYYFYREWVLAWRQLGFYYLGSAKRIIFYTTTDHQ